MEDAIRVCERAVQINPSLAQSHTHLGTMRCFIFLKKRVADAYKDSNRVQEAIVHYQRALELEPNVLFSFYFLL